MKKRFLLLPVLVALSGCLHPVADDGKQVSLAEAIRRTKDHALAVRTDDFLRQLGREHRERTLLLGISGMIRSGATAAEARPALETAIGYVQILMTPGDRQAEAAAGARIAQLLELETAELWADLIWCERELGRLEAMKADDSIRACRERISELKLELRTQMGLPAGEDFESLAPGELPDFAPTRREALLLAFRNRPEFKGSLLSPELRLAMLEKLEALPAPDASDFPATRGLRCAARLLRFPEKLAVRQLAERKVPPEFRELAMALGVAAEIDIDLGEIARFDPAAKERGSDWRKLQMRLRVDLGLPVDGEVALPAMPEAPTLERRQQDDLQLLAGILRE